MEKIAFLNIFNMGKNAPIFLKNRQQMTGVGSTFKPYSKEQILNNRKDELIQDGNGFIGDSAFGLAGLFNKELGSNLKNKVAQGRQKIEELDNNLASKMLNKLNAKEGGFLHKSFTKRESIPVGEMEMPKASIQEKINWSKETGKPMTEFPERPNAKLYVEDARTPSLLAPAQNLAVMSTPLLAASFVGEKMMGDEKQANVNEEKMEKISNELMIERMDKVAALEKVAELEEELEIKDELLKTAKEETLLYKQAMEKESISKIAAMNKTAELQKELFEKTAEHEELLLRTRARERSSNAIKIAESMLELGLIKQAQFDNKVDFLMDCDSETFETHYNLTKKANNGEKGLESSPYLIEYSNKEEVVSNNRGLSKRGQTIGEAASELIK